MASHFLLKVKTTDGVKKIDNLNSSSSFEDLKLAVGQLMKINAQNISILHGFPPKKLSIPDTSVSLEKLQIFHGDCLQVEEISVPEANPDKEKDVPKHEVKKLRTVSNGILTRHIIPADNSCLFASIHYVLNGGGKASADTATSVKLMRQVVADTISADPELYSTAVLDDKPNAEYCRWIVQDSSWGGAIELNILSTHFGVEIDVVNAQTGRIDRFGETSNFATRVLLIYDGVHYDPLVLEMVGSGEARTVFSTDDDEILSKGLEIGHEAKSSRQFTDVLKFRLVCLQCRVNVIGQLGALNHTKTTGHTQFGEI